MEGEMAELLGVIPILPTIFDSAGGVDEAATLRVADYIIQAGGRGIVFPGLASEYDQLLRDERLHLAASVGRHVAGRVPFVVGASAEAPDDVIAYAQAGADGGSAAAMILTPKSFADDLAGMAGFFREVADATGLAIMVQNAPPPMGLGLALEKVADLARAVEAIVYVKEEAAPSGQRMTRLAELAGGALDAVFGGAGARYVIDELKRGARGTMPACEITELHVAMLDRFDEGDEQGARDLFERTLPLLSMQAVFRWRLTKRVLMKRGIIDCDHVRAPGPSLDRYDVAELDVLLARLSDLMPPKWA
jgi:4-hydroxy-tetrahydrodipicolinate synthase